jgi:hypothetical protein
VKLSFFARVAPQRLAHARARLTRCTTVLARDAGDGAGGEGTAV